jgi:hypothetical protein
MCCFSVKVLLRPLITSISDLFSNGSAACYKIYFSDVGSCHWYECLTVQLPLLCPRYKYNLTLYFSNGENACYKFCYYTQADCPNGNTTISSDGCATGAPVSAAPATTQPTAAPTRVSSTMSPTTSPTGSPVSAHPRFKSISPKHFYNFLLFCSDL